MPNILTIDGYSSVIDFNPETCLFRGEFVGLNGSADFYATNNEEMMQEGRRSLQIYVEVCSEAGIKPERSHHG